MIGLIFAQMLKDSNLKVDEAKLELEYFFGIVRAISKSHEHYPQKTLYRFESIKPRKIHL